MGCTVKLKNKLICEELRHMLGIESRVVSYNNMLRWYGYDSRKDDLDWVKRCIKYEVEVL